MTSRSLCSARTHCVTARVLAAVFLDVREWMPVAYGHTPFACPTLNLLSKVECMECVSLCSTPESVALPQLPRNAPVPDVLVPRPYALAYRVGVNRSSPTPAPPRLICRQGPAGCSRQPVIGHAYVPLVAQIRSDRRVRAVAVPTLCRCGFALQAGRRSGTATTACGFLPAQANEQPASPTSSHLRLPLIAASGAITLSPQARA